MKNIIIQNLIKLVAPNKITHPPTPKKFPIFVPYLKMFEIN